MHTKWWGRNSQNSEFTLVINRVTEVFMHSGLEYSALIFHLTSIFQILQRLQDMNS